MNMKLILKLMLVTLFLSGCTNAGNNSEEAKYTKYLIKNGCMKVQIDIDGNTCNLNGKENNFNLDCTNKISTEKLEKLKCVEIKTPNTNCQLLSGTMNEETYFKSPDAKLCTNSGCDIRERAYFPPTDRFKIGTGYYTFECISKQE